MKYCPYAVNRHIVQQTADEYNTEGQHTSFQLIENNTAEFISCKGEECGAYFDGRCHYNGIKE